MEFEKNKKADGGELQEDQEKIIDQDDGKGKQKKKKQLGGIKTMPFIFANEICDRFASAGSHANLISYLTQELNMPLVQASNTLTNFGGTSSFTSLIGALIADSFAGRFWTITGGSIIYEMVSGKSPYSAAFACPST